MGVAVDAWETRRRAARQAARRRRCCTPGCTAENHRRHRTVPLHVTIACNGNTRSAPGKPEMKVVRSARSGIRSRSVCSSLSVWA